jgi:hypothetical protein
MGMLAFRPGSRMTLLIIAIPLPLLIIVAWKPACKSPGTSSGVGFEFDVSTKTAFLALGKNGSREFASTLKTERGAGVAAATVSAGRGSFFASLAELTALELPCAFFEEHPHTKSAAVVQAIDRTRIKYTNGLGFI